VAAAPGSRRVRRAYPIVDVSSVFPPRDHRPGEARCGGDSPVQPLPRMDRHWLDRRPGLGLRRRTARPCSSSCGCSRRAILLSLRFRDLPRRTLLHRVWLYRLSSAGHLHSGNSLDPFGTMTRSDTPSLCEECDRSGKSSNSSRRFVPPISRRRRVACRKVNPNTRLPILDSYAHLW
jgi:hypothetical protein